MVFHTHTQSEFFGNTISGIAALAVASFVLPAALFSSIAFAAIYFYLFRRYLLVSRDVNRIAATTASPLFSNFAEALRGVTTIRAFGKEAEYQKRLFAVLDETLAFWYLGATLDVRPFRFSPSLTLLNCYDRPQVWLSIRVQLLSAFCLLVTATFATYTHISPGLAGIAITSSQTVLVAVDQVSQAYGRLVLSMNSLERMTEYLRLRQEPEGREPPAIWPSAKEGEVLVEVRDLVMRFVLLHRSIFTQADAPLPI
jgi:ABC-type multidrug transport system fused ATPase/permease subunit